MRRQIGAGHGDRAGRGGITHQSLRRGHGIALSTWLVRIGLVIAPAVVGAAADTWGLAAALAIPLVAGIVIAATTPVLTGESLRLRHQAVTT